MRYDFEQDSLVKEALAFAKKAHRSVVNKDGTVGQKRKYSDEPYEVHPIEVAEDVARSIHNSPLNIAVALLHDVEEDTSETFESIYNHFMPLFGHEIASQLVQGVREVSDVSTLEDGNRAVRKAIDRDHAARATPERKTVKLADIKRNFPSIVEHDPGFAIKWVAEKADVHRFLSEGDPDLFEEVGKMLSDFLNSKRNRKK